MRHIYRLLFGMLVLGILLGCRALTRGFSTPAPNVLPTGVDTPTGGAVRLPSLAGNWRITFTQSGGLMGMSRRVEISSGGDMTVTDLLANKSMQDRLHQDTLDKISQLVADSTYVPETAPSACADCFNYDLQIVSGDQRFEVKLNQVNLPNSGLQPLVDYLSNLVNNQTR